MDGESSYESDISESWSLIDINLNEESLSVTDVSESPLLELKTEKPGKENENELEIEDFVRKCKETNKAEFSRVADSESGASVKESCSRTDSSFLNKKNFSDDAKNDSGDSESIEILEMDGNYQDSDLDRLDVSGFDQLDISTNQSDDEESLEGNSNTENRSNNSTVIRRRKRKTTEDGVHSVNSESVKKKVESCTGVREISDEWSGANSSPVYKHYRNNVVNTVLSLSVGVIFAGVACLAIGHFLGVQDASETAVELAETLKKLQAENAALQSALLTLEMNSKLELPSNQPPNDETPPLDPTKAQVTDLNKAALSAVRSSMNSIEWLSRLHGLIGKNKLSEGESGVEVNRLGKYILDQVHSLNRKMEDGAKFFEDADKKISKYLQRIIKRLSSSQDNIEVLHERLIKLKDTLNSKINKDPNAPDEIRAEEQVQKKVPVTEHDLQTIRWGPEKKVEKSLKEDYRNSVLFYNFPQPEEYYKDNSRLNQTASNEKRENKKRGEEKKKAKQQTKNSWKKEKSKEKKGGKKRKSAVNKFDKVFKNDVKTKQKDRTGRVTFKQVAFNFTSPQSKKHHHKTGEKATKHKRKCKKCKHPKSKKVPPSNPKRGPYLKRNKFGRGCSGPRCFNLTGHWMFKWADGREEFRRYETVGEWQFDRARARRELRDYNFDDNWQFRRAMGREYNRGKYEKYFGKDFFHERFSWI